MDPLTAGALITGASSLIGQGIQNTVGRKLAGYSYKKDLEQWNRQNAYNHPKAQMERLKSAGLNPNLVYGTGAVGNTSAQGPTYKTPEFKLDTKVDALATLGQYNSVKQTQAQTNNIEADTLNKQTENYNKILQQEILIKQAEKLGIDIEKLKELNPLLIQKYEQDLESQSIDITQKKAINPYQATITANQAKASEHQSELIKSQIEQARASTGLTKEQTTKTSEETKNVTQQRLNLIQDEIFKRYENQLKSVGIDSKDSPLFKVFARILAENHGSEPSAIMKWLDENKPSTWLEKIKGN